jgi:Ice-binding-like
VSTSLGVPRTVVRRGATALVVAGCAGALLVGVSAVQRAAAQTTTVDLGDAAPYAVLAGISGSTGRNVTGSGTSSITGDVGGTSVTGLDGQVNGTIRTGNDTLAQARADLASADDTLATSAVTSELTSAGGTLRPGVYGFAGAIDVSGSLTLDAGGDGDATFVLKTDSTLTTADGASVTLAGGARACNVYWLSGGSATVDGTVVGNFFGRAGITAHSGANVTGRLLSREGDVSLESATVRRPTDCGSSSTASTISSSSDDDSNDGYSGIDDRTVVRGTESRGGSSGGGPGGSGGAGGDGGAAGSGGSGGTGGTAGGGAGGSATGGAGGSNGGAGGTGTGGTNSGSGGVNHGAGGGGNTVIVVPILSNSTADGGGNAQGGNAVGGAGNGGTGGTGGLAGVGGPALGAAGGDGGTAGGGGAGGAGGRGGAGAPGGDGARGDGGDRGGRGGDVDVDVDHHNEVDD